MAHLCKLCGEDCDCDIDVHGECAACFWARRAVRELRMGRRTRRERVAMIVYRTWFDREKGGRIIADCEGWFLFGVIPLYSRKFSR